MSQYTRYLVEYNRGCNDINCLSDQVCVIARDECTANKPECGTYPTCISNGAKETCRTKMCEQGTYCKTEDGVPKCIKTNSGLAYDPPGVPPVNNRNVPSSNYPPVPADPWSSGSRYANSNPYANANAPPAEDVNRDRGHSLYPSLNPVNPPYPTNNNGFPPYPGQSNNNYNNRPSVDQYGRPIYPPQNNNNYNNRPQVDQFGNPIYPSQRPAYPYPQQNLPYNGWGGTNNPNSIYRRNSASLSSLSVITFVSSMFLTLSIGLGVPI
ncbi:hypothetical protein QAD02_017537 [Eretmocerus hayati]|uniref:Uncharacterized protein n=1 Tax=Eretmocerus hayati TaxID=131215 RepID=A0ACC2PDV0_9HYME|nr:hypothetical protein QAD02_017537 [Eretmocerus hayati]